MSHSFRDDPRFLITLLPALEVSRLHTLDTLMDLERQIQEIKTDLGKVSTQPPGSLVPSGRISELGPPPQLQIAASPPPPPASSNGSQPKPHSQAGFILAEARRLGGRIDGRAIALAATQSNDPRIMKLRQSLSRNSAMGDLVSRGYAVRGDYPASLVLTPRGLAAEEKEAREHAPMPGNLRRALARVAGPDRDAATAATQKATRKASKRIYPKGLPPGPNTQHGFILAEARRHGGTINAALLIAAAKRERNPIIKAVGSPHNYGVARSGLVRRGLLQNVPGERGEGVAALTKSGMEATNYVVGVSSTEAGPANKAKPAKPVKSARPLRVPGLSQADYLARLAMENGGTINNEQIREAVARDGIYPKLATPVNLSVAVAKALKDGKVTRVSPGVLEATRREKHKYEKQQQHQSGHEAPERASAVGASAEAGS